MFELITGEAKHIPSKPALPVFISVSAQLALVGALLLPLLFVTGQLPATPTMLAFVAAPPAPPPPPPPAAAKKATSPENKPVPTTGAAPIEAPAEIAPERPDDEIADGVTGGVEGGIPGGVLGGVVGGLPADIPPPPPPPPPPAPPAPRAPLRIGGQIQAPELVHRVEPIYSVLAVHAHVSGTVILEAIVDAEGRVAEVKVLRSGHRLLDGAAIAAVRQWRYSPLVLNGIRESFVLTVVLSFQLRDS